MEAKEVNQIIDETFENVKYLRRVKGGEYSKEEDALSNFKESGYDIEEEPEVSWRVLAKKHWDAIGTYIRDVKTDTKRERAEAINGRIDDLICYLILLKGLNREREAIEEYKKRLEEAMAESELTMDDLKKTATPLGARMIYPSEFGE